MAWDGVMVRYGEIGIKSQPVRRQMTHRLRQNIFDALLRDGIEGDVQLMGPRLWMAGPDVDALIDVARRTFGVVSVSPAKRCDSSMESMGAAAADVALQYEWTTFAVRSRRQGHHDYSSQDMAIQVGSAIFKAAEAAGRSPKVDLDHPDLEIFIEARDTHAFVSTQQLDGPGGLPLGSQGKVALLLNDKQSAVAAWLMMRRGCRVVPIHAGDMGSAPVELVEALQKWGLGEDVTVLPVCSRQVTKQELLKAAAKVAKRTKGQALVTGETLDSTMCDAPMPILRPVCGLDPTVVDDIAKRLGVEDEEPAADMLVDSGGEPAEELLRLRQVVTV